MSFTSQELQRINEFGITWDVRIASPPLAKSRQCSCRTRKEGVGVDRSTARGVLGPGHVQRERVKPDSTSGGCGVGSDLPLNPFWVP